MNNFSGQTDEKALLVASLIAGFLQQTLTPAERDALHQWVTASEGNRRLFEELTSEENVAAGLQKLRAKDSVLAYQKLRKKIPFVAVKKRQRFWPYAVAASLVLVAVSWLLFRPQLQSAPGQAVVRPAVPDIPPGSDRAVLTLVSGRRLVLENEQNGALAQEGRVTLTKVDSGQLVYAVANEPVSSLQYNTLSVPRGGRYRLTLCDGTRVWLNAASSLHYPVAFGKTERVVELEGEAYLEVAHDAGRPFILRSKGQQVTVLGTRFNVQTYAGETAVTTLVEGRVRLATGTKATVLHPGEQVWIRGENSGVQPADIETALAWKEGLFRFRNATIEQVMKEVSRWYNADVSYEGSITDHFNGEIARNLPVSKVLDLLQKTGRVHFVLNSKTITVSP